MSIEIDEPNLKNWSNIIFLINHKLIVSIFRKVTGYNLHPGVAKTLAFRKPSA